MISVYYEIWVAYLQDIMNFPLEDTTRF